MKRLVIIGKWLKGKKITIIDLQSYRELRQKQKDKGLNDKSSKEAPDHKVLQDI
jgi:hypothetical protein